MATIWYEPSRVGEGEEERKTHRGRDVRLLTYGASSERKALGTLLYSTLFPGFNDDIEAVSYKNSSRLITNDDSAPPPLNRLHTESAIFITESIHRRLTLGSCGRVPLKRSCGRTARASTAER